MTADNNIKVTKSVGRIATLAQEVAADPCDSGIGIGHTRWATHGAATKSNAHPHIGGDNILALAHNGVIEDFAELRTQLKQKGYTFNSETDTEVVAHLLADVLKPKMEAQEKGGPKVTVQDTLAAIKDATAQLRGTFGLAIIFRQWSDSIFVARLGSPLVIGVGDGEHFIASDAQPLVGFTEKIVYLSLIHI